MSQERQASSRLVRLCPEEGTWLPVEDGCWWDECNGRKHRVHRMLICSRCSQCHQGRKEFNAHECFDAY